eukprot:TRINITY_DN64372_c0_g1_i1.p1 TRINITY_DN64372_c0_g1~~TRINITY_DN64372_c0_g1_i1.p1  ORF type:complete len:103 (-),score=11.96 TRINITY_DN64372_c0_g1_i1:93-401(-)
MVPGSAVPPQRGGDPLHHPPLPVFSLLPGEMEARHNNIPSINTTDNEIHHQLPQPRISQPSPISYRSPPLSPSTSQEDADVFTSDSCGWVHERGQHLSLIHI